MENETKPEKAQLLPMHDNIVMESMDPIKKAGAFHVPEAYQKTLNQGIVVDKGDDCTEKVNIGDIVFFEQHSESRLNFRGKSYIIVSESACLGIIRGAKIDPTEAEEPRIIIPRIL